MLADVPGMNNLPDNDASLHFTSMLGSTALRVILGGHTTFLFTQICHHAHSVLEFACSLPQLKMASLASASLFTHAS